MNMRIDIPVAPWLRAYHRMWLRRDVLAGLTAAAVVIPKAIKNIGENGITLWLAALNPRAFDVPKRSSLFRTLGHERMFHNLEQAVAAYTARGR